MTGSTPRALPVGGTALSFELGDAIDPVLNERVRALDRSLAADPVPGVLEAVPTYRSLLVVYDPRRTSFTTLRDALLARVEIPRPSDREPRLRKVPTVYGGADGPDLDEVATRLGLSPAEVIALHAGTEYTALMLGFMPGFAYLGVLPAALELPRRTTPRTRVPAGSVGTAGRQTGIYPAASPGGWNLIGRTAVRLFDPSAASPSWIGPGDRVRFVPVPALPEASALATPAGTGGIPALEVADAGLSTTVQDAGRFGHRRLGVTWSGAADPTALAAANALVGNPASAAVLECTVSGPALRFLATAVFAVTGGDLGPILHRADLGAWPVPQGCSVRARPGNVLTFSGRRRGCRAYVAFAGGLDVPIVLGSRATDGAAGLGGVEGRALRTGDRLGFGPPPPREPAAAASTVPNVGEARVRIVLGPQEDAFGAEAIGRLLEAEWTVGKDSDRTGCRLDGPPLRHRGPAEIVSDAMIPGCIQVPPDGRPILMLSDCPTTGGYPKVATVIAADLPALAQALPGEGRIRFESVSVADAERRIVEALGASVPTGPWPPPG